MEAYNEGYALQDNYKLSISCIDFHTSHIGCIAAMHYHDYIEILYGNNCDCVVYVNEKCFNFRSGDLCFINTKQPHLIINNSAPATYFVIKFSPSILSCDDQNFAELKYTLPVVTANKNFNAVVKKSDLEFARIKKIISTIYYEWFNDNICRDFVLRSQILLLFSELMRKWDRNEFSQNFSFNGISSDVAKAIPYIIENYATATETEVASYCKISYSYFSHLFKEVFGCSFSKYLTNTRLEVAKRRLLTTNDSITSIAHEVGFSSSSHLISAFKKAFDTTPLNFRKQISFLIQKNE